MLMKLLLGADGTRNVSIDLVRSFRFIHHLLNYPVQTLDPLSQLCNKINQSINQSINQTIIQGRGFSPWMTAARCCGSDWPPLAALHKT